MTVAVFWLVRHVTSHEIAIGAGLVASILVFFINRRRGATGILAILCIVIAGEASIVGIVLGSENAYLANDPIGDNIIMTISVTVCIITGMNLTLGSYSAHVEL